MVQLEHLPRTRAEAARIGERFYFTGKKCVSGHTAYRYVTTHYCSECAAIRRKKPSVAKVHREANRAWRARNLEAQRERERERHSRDRAKSRAAATRYNKLNADRVCARVKARDRKLRQATPPWADMKAIRAFYLACPKGYHVDHIVPINGKTVSGLHVLENLQYLTAFENCSKRNSFNDW